MRVAFIGVSHWHSPFYLQPVADSPDAELVGVADPGERAVEAVAARYGTRGFLDYRAMCDETKPDLVFALGRHIDMAATAEYLIEAGIPFAMEKPCGVTVAEVERLEARARASNHFVAIPFTYRNSRFRQLIDELAGGKELTYGLFRQIPGPVSRYRDWDVAWNLDRRLAGGGCTLNLSIHFFDLVHVLAPSVSWQVTSAIMSNELTGVDVEDFSATLLEGGGRRATVETGYFFPGKDGETVMTVCMDGPYFRWDGARREIIVTQEDGSQTFEAGVSQAAYSGDFVSDTLERLRTGAPPDAGLAEMVRAARMAERAYRLAGDEQSMTVRG